MSIRFSLVLPRRVCAVTTRKRDIFSSILLANYFHWSARLFSLLNRDITFSAFNFGSLLFIVFSSSISTCRTESVNSTTIIIMLTPLGTKEEDETKISTEYYSNHYTPQHHHYYYHPVPFNDDSNNLHHPQTPTLYDASQYYTLSPGYSHSHTNTRLNEEEPIHPVSSVYMPMYHHPHHHYPSEEMLFPPKTLDHQPTSMYDYNHSPMSSMPSNQIFPPRSNYIQPAIETTPCTTSNHAGEYLTSYVSRTASGSVRY